MKEQEPRSLRDMGFRRDPFGLPVPLESANQKTNDEQTQNRQPSEITSSNATPVVVFESVPKPFAQWNDISQSFIPSVAIKENV